MTETGPDVDLVLTTRELTRLLTAEHIMPELLEEMEFDSPLSESTGAGILFGTTGGVMEAALRTAVYALSGEAGRKEAVYDVNGVPVRTCTVSGLKNARLLMEDILRKKVEYDFVEVMACPGGCVGGGGQPIWEDMEMTHGRASILYELDEKRPLRYSHENPTIQPLSEKSHHLLHVH